MKGTVVPLLVAATLVVAPPAARAQTFGRTASDHVEWQVTSRGGRSVIAGYVRNDRVVRIERVRVRIEPTSAPGAPTWSFVSGTIAPGERGYFEAPVPAGVAAYRVSVESFDWARCGDG
jgi:hypothetical protein